MLRQVCQIEFAFKASLLNMLRSIQRILWTDYNTVFNQE